MDNSNDEINPADVLSDAVTKSVKAREFTVVLKALDPDAEGFMPLWKRVLSIKRGFADIDKAQPEDIDEAQAFLMSAMIEPSDPRQKQALLNRVTSSEMMAMLDAITGAGKVPPKKGGA
jgi:hypothetical protein